MSEQWYYSDDGRQLGPMTLDQLRKSIAKISRQREVFVWRPGFAEWTPAVEVSDLFPQQPPPLVRRPVRQRSSGRLIIAVLLVGGLIVYAFSQTGDKSSSSQPSNVGRTESNKTLSMETQPVKLPAATIADVRTKMPRSEQTLISAIERARAVYNSGQNEMAKGAARPARAKELCSIFLDEQVKDWIGEVDTLSSNSDGLGVLSIRIADQVFIKTWNNALSDVSDQTMIAPQSALFSQAIALSKGQLVKFGGRFKRDPTDCIRESSMTLRGSIQSPEFIFRFSDVQVLP